MKEVEIRLLLKCNFKCIFCEIPRKKVLKEDVYNDYKKYIDLMMIKNNNKPINFSITGGEPTLTKELLECIKYIKSKNKKNLVCLNTNGYFLDNKQYLKSLIDAGLNLVLLSFHSHIEETFEEITGVKGSYNILMKAIENLNFFNIPIDISFVICKLNYEKIDKTIEYFIKNIHFNRLTLSIMSDEYNYGTESNFKVKFSSQLKALYRGLDLLRENNKKDVEVGGIPFCRLKGYENSIMYCKRRSVTSKKCNSCKLKLVCPGLFTEYYECYGDEEINPITNEIDSILKRNILKNYLVFIKEDKDSLNC